MTLTPQYGTSQANTLYYDKIGYQEATNRKEVCAVKKHALAPTENSKEGEITNKVTGTFYL